MVTCNMCRGEARHLFSIRTKKWRPKIAVCGECCAYLLAQKYPEIKVMANANEQPTQGGNDPVIAPLEA